MLLNDEQDEKDGRARFQPGFLAEVPKNPCWHPHVDPTFAAQDALSRKTLSLHRSHREMYLR